MKKLTTLLVFALVSVMSLAVAQEDTVVDVVSGQDNLSLLTFAVTEMDLVETLSGEGPFTVFAPTNDAFVGAFDSVSFINQVITEEGLTNVLTYHVVPQRLLAADIVDAAGDDGMVMVETVQGDMIQVMVNEDGSVVLNGDTNVTQTDLEAGNGVVHIIDAVLAPGAGDFVPAEDASDGGSSDGGSDSSDGSSDGNSQ
ncbi:MAG: fasciclin domain-containing protein [Trueperaceae bacterium]|nr:fasciclin domain-containing protein [Trueperaceae bacterium]